MQQNVCANINDMREIAAWMANDKSVSTSAMRLLAVHATVVDPRLYSEAHHLNNVVEEAHSTYPKWYAK